MGIQSQWLEYFINGFVGRAGGGGCTYSMDCVNTKERVYF